MPLDLNPRKGFVLVETLVAVVLLALVAATVIQTIATALAGSQRIRAAFEASVILENLLFQIKSDEEGQSFARSHEGAPPPMEFVSPYEYTYRVDARILGISQKEWGDRYLYQDLKIRLAWKNGREFLLSQSVVRTKLPHETSPS